MTPEGTPTVDEARRKMEAAEKAWIAEHGPAPAGKGWSSQMGSDEFELVNLPGFRLPDRVIHDVDSVRDCQRHVYDALSAAMSERGDYSAWVKRERQAVAIAANAWAGSHPGTRTITVDDVERVEGLAVGHSDYGPKLALYVAELVIQGRTSFDGS